MLRNCTRSRLRALSLLCLTCAEVTNACALDRFYRVESHAPCVSDCVLVGELDQGRVVEYPTPFNHGTQVSRSALRPISLTHVATPIPIPRYRVQAADSSGQAGCRFATLDVPHDAGLRPGMSFDVQVFQGGLVEFHLLRYERRRAFGVYDTAHIRLE